ncbi:unnamed protein product [Linum tenue]|uniref:Uncharacterized protein n=2 Tax=Linum tenue TaxID=586396 RepID=A0AAV0IPE8_9ROSI|nr:unnamed protein product [Linum tenue]
MDADLSMSNARMPNEYVKHVSSGKEIEVIDLEIDDSPPEDEAVGSSQNNFSSSTSVAEGINPLQTEMGLHAEIRKREKMHARHRSPGNGYNRSGSMGLGFGGGSRMSPDGSARGGGHGFYNSEYRTFRNRGFARGGHRHGPGQQQRAFQQPPHLPPRKGDILMEAGRLAAEYLVSKGMLPQNALAGKWQNGTLKKVATDYLQQEPPPVQEGRVSVHSRLSTGSSDAGSSDRRDTDEYGSRNKFKGRRRGDYSRSYSSEWVRDSGRSSSGSERNRESPEGEGHYEVEQGGKGTDDKSHVSVRNNALGGKEEATDVDESRFKKYNSPRDNSVSKASSSGAEKEESDTEVVKGSKDSTDLNIANEEMEDLNNDESEKHTVPEDNISSKNGSDLLAFCNLVKIPTKIRSALTSKVPKVDQASSNGADILETVPPKGSDLLDEDVAFDDPLPSEMNDPMDSQAELSQLLPLRCAEEDNKVSPVYGSEHGKCIRSRSFSDGVFDVDSEFETSNEAVKFGRSSSVKERGEKRPADDSDTSQQQKKPRENLLPTFVPNAANKLAENLVTPKEEVVSLAQQSLITESSLGNSHECPENIDDEYDLEKQQFPGSFKICDLNLIESSDIHDNTDNEPVLIFPPGVPSQRATARMDADLSMSNARMPNEYVKHVSSGKEIEVIDLEIDDSPPEDEAVGSSQNKMEVEFGGSEGFSGNAQASGHINDVQDNYDGLTI